MKFACQYAIIRFMPFIETGEFANAGIVLFCPETGYFGFQVSFRKAKKINLYFAPIPDHIYREGIMELQEELRRVKKLIDEELFNNRKESQNLFYELVRARESTFRFSELRGVLSDSPEQKIEELFSHYVERGFLACG